MKIKLYVALVSVIVVALFMWPAIEVLYFYYSRGFGH